MWGSVYFQNGGSYVMEQLIFFHDHTMTILVGVMGLVAYMLMVSIKKGWYNRGVSEGQGLELVWTLVPIILLLMVAFPSLRLLYVMEEGGGMCMTIKVMGHQWFWVYEYTDMGFKEFESYMSGVADWLRLGMVDMCMVLPYSAAVRVVVSSVDVIHSWTIPSVGVKTDAVPGRLNQLFMEFSRPGVFMGQCSEICGANHSFMPILVGVISMGDFLGEVV